MIPSGSSSFDIEFTVEQQSSYTFYLDIDKNIISGYTDRLEAMKQAIYLILNTERYRYIIFSWNYGIELDNLFGMPVSFVLPEIERRIFEALIYDDRITDIDNFEFELPKKGVVYVKFTVHTVYGDLPIERTVNF